MVLVNTHVPQPGKSNVRVTEYIPTKVWLVKAALQKAVVPKPAIGIEGAVDVKGEDVAAAGGGLLPGSLYVIPANETKSRYMGGT
jgi:hypothetical protein